MTEKAYDYLPIGTALQVGKSEEDAVRKFVESRDDVEDHQVVGTSFEGNGFYRIHYSRPGVTRSDLLGYTRLRDICIECGEYIEMNARAPHQKYCSDKCRQRACRRRKRERDANL